MMRNLCLFLLLVLTCRYGFSQDSFWSKTSSARMRAGEAMPVIPTTKEPGYYSLDLGAFRGSLAKAPLRNKAAVTKGLRMHFPLPSGEMEAFEIYEAPVMHPRLQEKYPGIRAYTGKNATATICFTTSLFGVHARIVSATGEASLIDTYTRDLSRYRVYAEKDTLREEGFHCGVTGNETPLAGMPGARIMTDDAMFRTYRLAVSTTAAYSAYYINMAGLEGGTTPEQKEAVLAAIVTTMAHVNAIFERDMSLTMELVPDNDKLIFIGSDDFTGANNNDPTYVIENQEIVDEIIGSDNYDIGHLFNTGGGGFATIPAVCIPSRKARGISGTAGPLGSPDLVSLVAHEIGHQWGAGHTFNNSCNGNRSDATAVETGSGATVMGYGGICPPDVIDSDSPILRFHAVSIAQMKSHMLSSGCGTALPGGDATPIADAGSDYTIPLGTAFLLRGSGSDPDGDASLTYTWEQTNPQISVQPPSPDSDAGPNFRPLPASASPIRYMPALESVLGGNLTPTWEVVPNVARTMDFAFTVRDNNTINGGQTRRDDMTVTFAATGPFRVTSQDVAEPTWVIGQSKQVTWDVAGTTGSGINTSHVNILLSTNDGAAFDRVLASGVHNTGTATVTVPDVISDKCRILIEPVGNIYYAVNTAPFVIDKCTRPDSPAATLLTSSGATISWEGEAPAYEYYYSTDPGPPTGPGTPVNGNSVTLSSMLPGQAYHVWIRTSCSPGEYSLWAGPVSFTINTQTYAAGAGTEYDPAPHPGSTISGSCAPVLTISVPAGYRIVNIATEYAITTAGGALMDAQRSFLYSPTLSRGEAALISGSGNSQGTFTYARHTDFANGAVGNVEIQLRAWRTQGGTGCNETYQYVEPGRWKITATFEKIPVFPDANGIVYVKAGAVSGEGSDWNDALSELADALKAAKSNKAIRQVWVAKGTYKPLYSPEDEGFGNQAGRRNAFLMVSNMKVIGGFDPDLGITQPSHRRISGSGGTILSGDLDGNGVLSGNDAYHVVVAVERPGTASLDGFTVTGGNADDPGTSLLVGGHTISNEHGGGIALSGSSLPIANTIITGNKASHGGGMIGLQKAALILTNTVIHHNTATWGGGIYANRGSVVLTNTTLANNTATSGLGGALFNNSGDASVRNSIVYGNSSGIRNDNSGSTTYRHSLVQGATTEDTDGNLNGSANPLFTDAAGGDYRLRLFSPAINKGGNALFSNLGAATTDLDGNPRVYNLDDGGNIDLGPYENQGDPPVTRILYVSKNVDTQVSDKTGSSWENAMPELADALKWARENRDANLWWPEVPLQVWVAGGEYRPLYDVTLTNTGRSNVFLMVRDVQLYGGFAGTEASLHERDLSIAANASVLNGANTYHVVVTAGSLGAARLDGFTVTGGNADNSGLSMAVDGHTINNGHGGGIAISGSSLSITNTMIAGNKAIHGGGIIGLSGAAPVLTNATIHHNSATWGGGIYSDKCMVVLTNATLANNTATSGTGGALFNNSGKALVRNAIVYGNSNGIRNDGSGTTAYRYSLVQGATTDDANGNINGSSDPLFVDAADGDYRLNMTSPAVNKGSNSYYGPGQNPDLSAITTDLAGNPRIRGKVVDLGACETPYVSVQAGSGGIVYVKHGGAGSGNGSSWGNAAAELADALASAEIDPAIRQVWVAGGTYKPRYSPEDGRLGRDGERDNAFLLVKDVQVYGGFAGTEAALQDRNLSISANASILSGDLDNSRSFTGKDAYHVVVAAGDAGTARLDGFTITGGYSDVTTGAITVNGLSTGRSEGGGLHANASSPALVNLFFTGNQSYTGGGLFTSSSAAPLTNALFTANTATMGGGIYAFRGSSLTLTNATMSRNTAHDVAGGLYNHFNSTAYIRNSIICHNQNGSFGGADVHNGAGSSTQYAHSLVQGVTADDSNGNIDGSTDPIFANPEGGNYRFAITSPVINRGSNDYYNPGQSPDLSAVTTDLAGNARIKRHVIDPGVYETPYMPIQASAEGIVYVRQGGAGSRNGSSWSNAAPEPADALARAGADPAIRQVWVAGGVYKPLFSPEKGRIGYDGGRDNAFLLAKDVQVYGGFAGTETTLQERHLSLTANTSTLSGDLDNNNVISGGDAYHVVVAAGNAGTARLDGFTITGGNANGTGYLGINELAMYRYDGGGMDIRASSLGLANLIFTGNFGQYGGAIQAEATSLTLSNMLISSNKAGYGGGMYIFANSTITLTNVTFGGNSASLLGGALMNDNSTAHIRNSIVYGNNTGISILNNGIVQCAYSLVQGAARDDNGNIDGAGDPLFADAANGDYTLQAGSPAVNCGSNGLFPNLDNGTADLAGNPRVYGPAIDMGAYELIDASALPVVLVSFAALKTENAALLTWQTTGETDFSHFEIERSADARMWQTIGAVPAKRNGSYTFTDNSPFSTLTRQLSTLLYYRLKIVDTDGSFIYSGIEAVSFLKGNQGPDVRIYPNPAHKGKVRIELTGAGLEPARIQISDLLGRAFHTVEARVAELDASQLTPGIYVVQIRQGSTTITKKLIIAP